MILKKLVRIHCDSKGNERIVTEIVLKNFSCSQYSTAEHEYVCPWQYKAWLRARLTADSVVLSNVTKEVETRQVEHTSFLSFYSIYRLQSNWQALLIVPLPTNPMRGSHVSTRRDSLADILAFLRKQPSSCDFEVSVDKKHQLFDMSDEGLIKAMLIFSDV